MFDRIKSLFTTERTRSPARAQLAQINVDIASAQGTVSKAEERVASLQAIVTGADTAERELQAAIGRPAGPKALAQAAAGRGNAIGDHVDKAARAAQAAEAAKRALPAAEQAIGAAGAEIVRLENLKRKIIAEILIEHGDQIAKKYAATFAELCDLHDQLNGFARGVGSTGHGAGIVLSSEPLEVPRFELPSTPSSGGFYSPFLRHIAKVQTIAAASLAWSRFAVQLMTDPDAEVSSNLTPSLADEVGRHPEHLKTITPTIRERPALHDENLLITGAGVFAKEEERPRRQIKLS